MGKDLFNIDEPLNAQERYLHGINIRLNILIEIFSSFIDAYANQNNIATTSNTVVENNNVDVIGEDIEKDIEEELEVEGTLDLESMLKAELIDIIKERGLEFNTRMTKAELIDIIKKG